MGLLTNGMRQKTWHWFSSEPACVIPSSATEVWCNFQPLPNLDIQIVLYGFYSLPHCEEESHSIRVYHTGDLLLQLAPPDASVK